MVWVLGIHLLDQLLLDAVRFGIGKGGMSDLFGDDRASPDGFRQQPVELGARGVGVGAARSPSIDPIGFDYMVTQTVAAPLADGTTPLCRGGANPIERKSSFAVPATSISHPTATRKTSAFCKGWSAK